MSQLDEKFTFAYAILKIKGKKKSQDSKAEKY